MASVVQKIVVEPLTGSGKSLGLDASTQPEFEQLSQRSRVSVKIRSTDFIKLFGRSTDKI